MCSTSYPSQKNNRIPTEIKSLSNRFTTSSNRGNKGRVSHNTPASTCSSSSSYYGTNQKQEVHRICPVTGVLRDISVDYCIASKVLGKGHHGLVRESIHRDTRRIYACKSVDKSKIRRLDHLQREIYLLTHMKHHGILKSAGCYEDARHVHIVTERCTGGELFDKISDNTSLNGCFSEVNASRIIMSVLEAVAYLHKNDIVHRDIKPENILFESEQGDAIKLIDFGLARKHKKGDAPMRNPVGTAYYMSPEILKGKYDRSCDVWSVGIIAYILLCGYPPFNGETDQDIFESIRRGKMNFPTHRGWSTKSSAAKDFIKSLLCIDPKKRSTAQEALDHPWIARKSGQCERSVAKDDEMVARIQKLTSSIHKLKKWSPAA